MKTVVINERQYGLMFKDGRFVKMVNAGRYFVTGRKEIEIHDITGELVSERAATDTLLHDARMNEAFDIIELLDNQLCIRTVDGKFDRIICTPGKHAFRKDAGVNGFDTFDLTEEVSPDFPGYLFERIDPDLYELYSIDKFMIGLLYINGRLVRELQPGDHYFWTTEKTVEVQLVDTRLIPMNILGQEILTADKVPLRVNFVLNYRITDAAALYESLADYNAYMHQVAQMALREIVGRQKLDQILEDKDGISEFVFGKMKKKCAGYHIEVTDCGVRDIILPGAVRDIMSTVLIAEKKAQANVITRREEVASTRSLLNTAKLMEENPTLYKLKELEYVERICENVGSLNVGGSGDILERLTQLISSGKT